MECAHVCVWMCVCVWLYLPAFLRVSARASERLKKKHNTKKKKQQQHMCAQRRAYVCQNVFVRAFFQYVAFREKKKISYPSRSRL